MSSTTRAIWKVLLSPIPPSGAAPALPYPGFALGHGFNPEAWVGSVLSQDHSCSFCICCYFIYLFEIKWYDLLPFLTESDEVA